MTVQDTDRSRPETPAATKDDATTLRSYHLYFTSGLYDRRYPAPNRTMWRRIERFLHPQASVLDFGCGSGRYLFRLKGNVARAIGYDVSPAALEAVRTRAGDWPELAVLGSGPETLDRHIETMGQVDLVLCLFGVLGHITDPDSRAEALGRMRHALKPGTGRLLISVPNRARRFRAEQAASETVGLVRYQRQTEAGGLVLLNYQLFDPDKLVGELRVAGFEIRRIGCESILPESWLLHNAALRWIDGVLTPLCPARWGYGIYAEASC